jgi:hypothetical protein
MSAITRDLSRLAVDLGDSSSFGCQRTHRCVRDALTSAALQLPIFGNAGDFGNV